MIIANAVSAQAAARALYKKITRVLDERQRQRLVIRTSREPTPEPTIYFLTPDYMHPAGGVRVIYRHVDILNANGQSAVVLHHRSGFRCTWFENETRVMNLDNANVCDGDLIVLPEMDGDILMRLPTGTKHVIFNQNAHLTWQRASGTDLRAHVARPDLAGILTVSDHNKALLRHAFPACATVERLHVGIDTNLFCPAEDDPPARIAFMSRRGGVEARQVLELLYARGVLDGWEVVALDGLAHEAVAHHLQSARLFLAFTHQEGFGLPAAEAMACGNYVVGVAGFGGEEFFLPTFSAPIKSGDILAFAQAVETAVVEERVQPGWCRRRGMLAAKFIRETYSLGREESDVVSFYRSVFETNL
jgi:hypothetical protein